MTKCILLLLLFAASETSAQSDKKWTVSACFSPGIGFRSLTNSDPENEISDLIIEARNDSEEPQFQWGSSIVIHYNVWRGLNIGTGIEFGNYGQLSRDIPLFPSPEFPLEEFEYSELNENYDFIGAPLSFSWKFQLGERLQLQPEVGVAAFNFFNYRQRYTYKYQDSEEGTTESHQNPKNDDVNEANLWNYQFTFSFGVGFKLGDRSSISAIPFYSFLQKPLYNTPVLGKYYKGGLSLRYSFLF